MPEATRRVSRSRFLARLHAPHAAERVEVHALHVGDEEPHVWVLLLYGCSPEENRVLLKRVATDDRIAHVRKPEDEGHLLLVHAQLLLGLYPADV